MLWEIFCYLRMNISFYVDICCTMRHSSQWESGKQNWKYILVWQFDDCLLLHWNFFIGHIAYETQSINSKNSKNVSFWEISWWFKIYWRWKSKIVYTSTYIWTISNATKVRSTVIYLLYIGLRKFHIIEPIFYCWLINFVIYCSIGYFMQL